MKTARSHFIPVGSDTPKLASAFPLEGPRPRGPGFPTDAGDGVPPRIPRSLLRGWFIGSRSAGAYSIVEVMVAAGLLVMAIAAAASLALTMVAQEEGNARTARALNLQEQACRLYQLGLDPTEIEGVLAYNTNSITLSFATNSGVITGVGTMDAASSTLIFSSGSPITATSGAAVFRTNTMQVVRPSIR